MPFSVLMSLYIKENPDYLRQSLDSVFNQTLPPDEVILVEDGPLTEDLYSVLDIYEQKYPQFKRVRIPVNGGLGKALNEGLKRCSNELVARMDTDDVCFHDRFEKQIDYMNSHPEIAASSGWIEEFENDIDNVRSVKRVPETPDEVKRYGVKRCPLNHPAVILRKSVVESVGGYIHFPLFEDWYLWARLMSHGYRKCGIHLSKQIPEGTRTARRVLRIRGREVLRRGRPFRQRQNHFAVYAGRAGQSHPRRDSRRNRREIPSGDRPGASPPGGCFRYLSGVQPVP